MDVYVDTPRWLLKGRIRPASPRLFCFPHGGGSAAEYVGWARNLSTVEVCGIQLPGRGNRLREPSFTDMDELVAAVVGKIPFGSHGRFAFFGHSMGAVVAYEVTRLLLAQGRSLPERLILSGFRAPSRPRPLRTGVPLHQLPDDQLIAELAGRFGGFPDELVASRELRAMMAGYLRADCQVLETYQWRESEPLPVPITVLGGRDDRVTLDDLRAWQRHTTEPVSVRLFPGGHFYFREQGPAVLRTIADLMVETRRAAA